MRVGVIGHGAHDRVDVETVVERQAAQVDPAPQRVDVAVPERRHQQPAAEIDHRPVELEGIVVEGEDASGLDGERPAGTAVGPEHGAVREDGDRRRHRRTRHRRSARRAGRPVRDSIRSAELITRSAPLMPSHRSGSGSHRRER